MALTGAANGASTARSIAREDGLEAALNAAGVRVPAPESLADRSLAAVRIPPLTVLAMRLGASEHLLRTALAHLNTRRVGDGTLLLNPLVRTQLAEAVTEQLLVEAHLGEVADGRRAFDEAARARTHRRITDVDRALLRLLGGQSFLTDGPGGTALVSECLPDLLGDELN